MEVGCDRLVSYCGWFDKPSCHWLTNMSNYFFTVFIKNCTFTSCFAKSTTTQIDDLLTLTFNKKIWDKVLLIFILWYHTYILQIYKFISTIHADIFDYSPITKIAYFNSFIIIVNTLFKDSNLNIISNFDTTLTRSTISLIRLSCIIDYKTVFHNIIKWSIDSLF